MLLFLKIILEIYFLEMSITESNIQLTSKSGKSYKTYARFVLVNGKISLRWGLIMQQRSQFSSPRIFEVLKTKSKFPNARRIYTHTDLYSIIYLIIYRGDYYMMDAEHGVCNNRAPCISTVL